MKKKNIIAEYLHYSCEGIELIKAVLFYVFFWGLLAHVYAFTNFTFSHDSLGSLYTLDPIKIALGRFGVFIYKYIIASVVTLPWTSGVFSLLFIGIACVLICRIFQIEKNWQIILIAGILTTNITITVLISTYIHDLGADSLALLLSTMAAYSWNSMHKRASRKLWNILGIIFPLVGSLSLYQSYVSVTGTVILFVLLLDLLGGEKFALVMREGLLAVVCVLVSCFIYLTMAWFVCHIMGIEMVKETYNSLSNMGNMGITLHTRLEATYLKLFETFIIVPISSFRYPLVTIINGALLCFAFYMWVRKWWRIGVKEKMLSVILILIAPFAMNISGFLAGMSSDLMLYALWLIYIPIIVSVSKSDQEKKIGGGGARKKGVMVMGLICLIIVANIQTANTVYMKKDVERQATLSRVTSMLSAIEQQENYSYGKTPIALLGYPLGEEQPVLVEGNIKNLAGNGGADQITYGYPWQAYFEYVLNYKINLVREEQMLDIERRAEVKEMPCFPNAGSIKMVDDVLVVKMSE